MRRLLFCFYTALFATLPCARSQEHSQAKKIRILFLVDASSSMNESWQDNRSRFQQAAILLKQLMDSLSRDHPATEFGLRVFGHQYPAQQQQCYDSRLEIPFSPYNTEQIATRLEALKGYGVSPIALSLKEAAADFRDELHYAYSMILVTDGAESCGGDICEAARQLLGGKLYLRPYIISMIDHSPLQAQYSCLGTLLTAADRGQADKILAEIRTVQEQGFRLAQSGARSPIAAAPAPEPSSTVKPVNTIPAAAPKKEVRRSPEQTATPRSARPLLQREQKIVPKATEDGSIFVDDQVRKERGYMNADEFREKYPSVRVE